MGLAAVEAAGGGAVVLARGIVLSAITAAAGAAAFRRFVQPRAAAVLDAAECERLVRRIGWMAGGAIVLMVVPRIWLQASGYVEVADPVWPMVPKVLATTWGKVVVAQGVLALITTVAFARVRSLEVATWLAAALCVTPAFTGHASASEKLPGLAIVNSVLHVGAAAAWIGALLLVGVLAHRSVARGTAQQVVPVLVEGFHQPALAAVSVLFGSGVLAIILRVMVSTGAWWGSDYLNALLLKLGLLGVVLGFGAWHAVDGKSKAERTPVSVARTIGVELAFAVGVLGATALLTGTGAP